MKKYIVVVMVMISIVFMLTGCPKVISITYTSPSDGSTEVELNATLTWTAKNASSFDVYLGTTSNPPVVSTNQTALSYSTGALNPGTKYYWKVVAKADSEQKDGPLWNFTTLISFPDGISVKAATLPDDSQGEILIHGKNITNIGGCGLIITYDDSYLEIDTSKGNNGVETLNSFVGGLMIIKAATLGTLKIDTAFMNAKNVTDEDICKIHVKTKTKTGNTNIDITGEVIDPDTNTIATIFTGNTLAIE